LNGKISSRWSAFVASLAVIPRLVSTNLQRAVIAVAVQHRHPRLRERESSRTPRAAALNERKLLRYVRSVQEQTPRRSAKISSYCRRRHRLKPGLPTSAERPMIIR